MPIFLFLGPLIAGFFATAVGQMVLSALVSIAVNALVAALRGDTTTTGTFSVLGSMRASGDEPRSFAMGQCVTSGSFVYGNTWGSSGSVPNTYLTQVIALSDLPVDGLVSVFVDSQEVTLSTTAHDDYGYPVEEYTSSKGTDYLWIKFYDGNQTTADDFLVNTVASDNRPYESTRVGTGIAYVIITARIKEALYTGVPVFKFVLNGMPMYDPSQDGSESGTGDHRWDDSSTWEYSENPMVQAYNILRGITYDDTWFYGFQGLSAGRLPASSWVTQIEKCNVQVDVEDDDGNISTENKFRCSAEVLVDTTLGDALGAINTACSGRLSEVGGIYKPSVGDADTAVVSLTDDDIITSEEQSFTPFEGLADTINGVIATWPDPDENWNTTTSAGLYDADMEVLDGDRRLTAEIDLPMVPYSDQVDRLLVSALAEARRARKHTFTMPPEFSVLEPNDVIAWTSDRYGYSEKEFLIDAVVLVPNGNVVLEMTEIDIDDYG